MEQTHAASAGGSAMYSEFLSIVAIVFCALAFYFYIQRLELPHLADSMWQDPEPVQETRVTATALPFSITPVQKPLVPPSMTDGLMIRIQATVACTLHYFWGVKCQGVTEALRSCDQLHGSGDSLDLEEKLQGISLSSGDELFLDSNETREIHLEMEVNEDNNDRVESDLGPMPRSRYPLVIVIRQGCEEALLESPPVSIEYVMWIYHLPDETVTKPCHVISQLIITSQGQVCNLQKMFMAAENERTDGDAETRNPTVPAEARLSPSEDEGIPDLAVRRRYSSQEHSEQCEGESERTDHSKDNDVTCQDLDKSCAVCQNAPITRVIIPCRHACVCHHCLGHLFLCPMCRGPIVSHFQLTSGPGSLDRDGEVLPARREVDWVRRIHHGMDRLNQWLGFV